MEEGAISCGQEEDECPSTQGSDITGGAILDNMLEI